MLSVEINDGLTGILTTIVERFGPAHRKAALKAANYAGGAIAEEVYSRHGGSGNLARSFLPATFIDTDEGVGAAAVSDLVYAGRLNRGDSETDPVTSTRPGGMLAMPLTDWAKKRWPRDVGGELFLIKSKRGNLLLMNRDGPQYLLRKSFHISGSGYIDAAAEKSKARVAEIIDEANQQIIDEAE